MSLVNDFLLHRDTLKTAKVTLPVFAHFCYRDDSGDHVVYLTESGDRRHGGKTLRCAGCMTKACLASTIVMPLSLYSVIEKQTVQDDGSSTGRL